jgi:hypothetical protein
MARRRKPPKVTFDDIPCSRCGGIFLEMTGVDPAPIGWPPPWHGVCRNCKTEEERNQILGNSGARLVTGAKSET